MMVESWTDITEGLILTKFDYIFSLFIKDYYLFAATEDGMWRFNFSSLVDVDNQKLYPRKFSLSQNYPNPFNPTTNIGFRIANFGFVSLKVYDVLGREVATLINEEKFPGEYEIKFDASHLSSGIYFYKLQTEKYSSTKKMILLK